MTKNGWIYYHNPKEVVPEVDQDTHVFGPNCRCKPNLIDGILVHNSYDRREFIDVDELAATDAKVKRGQLRVQ